MSGRAATIPVGHPGQLGAADFRRLALALPGAETGAHHGREDFRVRGRIFATLAPDGASGVVLLAPEEQAVLVAAEPGIFTPVPGGWGFKGSTQVRLAAADEAALRSALALAWRRRAPKRLLERSKP